MEIRTAVEGEDKLPDISTTFAKRLFVKA